VECVAVKAYLVLNAIILIKKLIHVKSIKHLKCRYYVIIIHSMKRINGIGQKIDVIIGGNEMSYKIKYKTITVIVSGNKPTSCDCCAKRPDPRGLHTHHWLYKYSIKEVRDDPELAKENSSVLCFYDHRLANCLRILEENQERVDILKRLKNIALLKGRQ